MCSCGTITRSFKVAGMNPYHSYLPALELSGALVEEGTLELYAGDCPLADAPQLLAEERHYTVVHYFRCRHCGKYYMLGACIRGKPIFKEVPRPSKEILDRMLWGRSGVFFG